MADREKAPPERRETLRQEIVNLLGGRELTIGELSKQMGKSEAELYDHLESLKKYKSLQVIPAQCLKCGYVFESRHRVKKPGKCPQCKSTRIDPPMFSCEPEP
ncbi:ArsR family transcriptional regulator [Exilibacterium tricleocarpae]|uniref:ArsR family transcriptional regulator n=1 Tax=Exilibacterium tricleocarpae TaxID=2591008 RepID=A0A545U5H2_9GAMM|nr:ArsR family transcriptional regulator [Exilibacterium tricleocarpae]TQV84653.1 ArsR family transcriptional regulator [Exilibacterium tricleocarpae]